MLRVLLTGFVVTCVLVGGPNEMEAQVQVGQSEYDARALRLESSWGYGMLVRGREGTVVGRVGGFRAPDLAETVAPSTDAIREAREFKQRYDRGMIALAVGAVATYLGAGLVRDGDPTLQVPAYAALAVASGFVGYSVVQFNRGSSALARSIWWHNRHLAERR